MMMRRFQYDSGSFVMEIASNDGYLLQYFVEAGVPVLGIEPAANVAAVAEGKGVPTLVRFFGTGTAQQLVLRGKRANLVIANNVLAHVPDLNDFVKGLRLVLKPEGIATLEFPHLLRLIAETQFDTIYHEHFSYFSLLVVDKVLASHGLKIFDVQEVATHGGSLRIFVRHMENDGLPVSSRVGEVLRRERDLRLDEVSIYSGFGRRVEAIKRELLRFLIDAADAGKRVAGYGAPAKGNTLLNYCGIRSDLMEYTVDRSPHKQGRFLPGTHIPVHPPDRLRETKPDYVLILPWNLRDEIVPQLRYISEWGGKLVVPIPHVTVLD
jgi:SAM-dependent methyltransferase